MQRSGAVGHNFWPKTAQTPRTNTYIYISFVPGLTDGGGLVSSPGPVAQPSATRPEPSPATPWANLKQDNDKSGQVLGDFSAPWGPRPGPGSFGLRLEQKRRLRQQSAPKTNSKVRSWVYVCACVVASRKRKNIYIKNWVLEFGCVFF